MPLTRPAARAGFDPEEDRRIEIRMGVKKEALILVVKNPYAHDLKYSEAGELLTTKKDSQRHGYGLKSIKRTAERYFGEVLTDGKDRVFTLTVILNLPQMTAQNSSSGLCGSGRK